MKTLADVISTGKLTDEQHVQLVELLGWRCRQGTKDKLARRLRFPFALKNCGLFSRVIIEDDRESEGIHYIAGQSYPDEIRTLRELILKG